MRFDPKKPYGTVVGHPWARYEQGSVLFDSEGRSLEAEQEVPEPQEVNNHDRDFALEQAREFLKNILADGPLARATIYRESEANNQQWEKVKTAFANMGGEAFKRGVSIYWKLKTE